MRPSMGNSEFSIDTYIKDDENKSYAVPIGQLNLPIAQGLPKTLKDIEHMQMMNQYRDDPTLSPEENAKRREHFERMVEKIKNQKEHSKSEKQRAKDKKKAKMAKLSKRKNRN